MEGTSTPNPLIPPENASMEERISIIEQTISGFIDEVNTPDPTWELCFEREAVKVWRMKDDNSGVYKIKFIGKIPHPQVTVLKVLFDHNLRKTWDSVIEDIVEGDELSNGSKVLYIATRSPVWGIAPRDFVHIRSERDPPEHSKTSGKVILDISTVHDESPDRANDGYVRAHTYVSGGLFETLMVPNMKTKELNETVKYTMVTQADVKGIIPKMIVNSVSSSATAAWFDSLTKACENYTNGTLKPLQS